MQRSQKFSPPSDSSASPTSPGGHSPQHTANRPESKAELKPLFTRAPLSLDREKNPSPPPRRRKRHEPKTPALTFDPLRSMIPSGRQETPATQTPVSHQGQPTPISTTNEFPDWIAEELDDQLASGTAAPPHPTTSKRPRAPSGSDESPQLPQPPGYPVPYSNLRFTDQYESPSSGGSSSSLATSYDSSPHPQYGLDSQHQIFHPELMAQYCDPTGADYGQLRRVTPDVYAAPRDPGYHPPQGGAWQYGPPYNNGYRDSSF